jgi:phosphoribosylaminoimidazole-succinocarboxamide synthase
VTNIGAQLYEGKAKVVFETDEPGLYLVHFKDDATALNGLKKGTITDKGVLNNLISTVFFRYLAEAGVPSHFVAEHGERGMLVKRVSIIPIEVVVRNVAAGSLAKRLGLEEGTVLHDTVLEFYYKRDDLGDPLINDYHIRALGIASEAEVGKMAELALKINDLLRKMLRERGVDLIDFKLEFGRSADNEVLLADEISPDTCRFWDAATGEKLDKDRFRRDMGGVEAAYQEMLRRLVG